jgi:ferredoxin
VGPVWSIAIDRERCTGSGMCIVYAPGTFAHDDETKAVVLDPPTDGIDEVQAAAEGCPAAAIRLKIDEGER